MPEVTTKTKRTYTPKNARRCPQCSCRRLYLKHKWTAVGILEYQCGSCAFIFSHTVNRRAPKLRGLP